MCLENVFHPINVSLLSGSVADREHRKWVEKAVPLSNNPYTMEYITKRKTSKIPVMASRSLFIFFCVENEKKTCRSFANKDSRIILETEDNDTELSSIYATLYKRDYYVQMNNNGIEVGKTKERNQDTLVRN